MIRIRVEQVSVYSSLPKIAKGFESTLDSFQNAFVDSFVPRKLGMVTRMLPFPSIIGATGVLSLLFVDEDECLRKNDNGFFLFWGSTGAFFSGGISCQLSPL